MHNWVIMNRQLLSSSFFTLLKPSLDPRHTSFKLLFKPLTESTSRFLLYFSCTFTLLKNKNSVSFNYQRQCAFKSLQNALPQNCLHNLLLFRILHCCDFNTWLNEGSATNSINMRHAYSCAPCRVTYSWHFYFEDSMVNHLKTSRWVQFLLLPKPMRFLKIIEACACYIVTWDVTAFAPPE